MVSVANADDWSYLAVEDFPSTIPEENQSWESWGDDVWEHDPYSVPIWTWTDIPALKDSTTSLDRNFPPLPNYQETKRKEASQIDLRKEAQKECTKLYYKVEEVVGRKVRNRSTAQVFCSLNNNECLKTLQN